MCPSYQVTREEMHSTRGRAHLLFEMLQQKPMKGPWKAEPVREALDLCLDCKGCKNDCPVNVDMATFKAEFLSHYYEGRLRPRHAYAMGLIPWWARLASLAPPLANFVSQRPGLAEAFKALGGISLRRQAPPFANETFKQWFFRRGPRNPSGRPVILWPDTFNNYFHPEVAKAAVEVLEHAGCHVIVPRAALCCGRPLYDYGFLPAAKRLLRRILDTLRYEIEEGIPIVGLEPSCTATFRDELHALFPMDEDAKRLREQTHTLGEFLEKKVKGYDVPKLRRRALVHGHCHHKSIMKMGGEDQLYKKMGLLFEIPDTGCCGLAGSSGFESGHDEISGKIGEQRLIPMVRQAAKDTLIVADGFSCKHQIKAMTDRRALHTAQVLQMALHDGPAGPPAGYPEVHYPDLRLEPGRTRVLLRTGAVLGVGVLLVGGTASALTRWRT